MILITRIDCATKCKKMLRINIILINNILKIENDPITDG